MTQEEINKAVKERLRIANERLSKKNGVDPTDPKYASYKRMLRFAEEHNMTLREAIAYHSKTAYQQVEKQLGRPLRNTSSLRSEEKKPIWNPLTGERWDGVTALAYILDVEPPVVRRAVIKKKRINNQFIEYIK